MSYYKQQRSIDKIVDVLYEEYKTYKTSKEKRAMKTWLYNLNLGTKQKDFCWRIIVGGHDE